MSTQVKAPIQIPSIMTANTFFWSPASTADGRRRNETKRTDEVASFLKHIGFEIINHDRNNVSAKSGDIEVYFHYSESTNNVYKSLHIQNKGLRSNITILKKLLV